MEQSQKHLLVVEDEPALNDLYTQIFTSEGYEVDSTPDGKKALELLSRGGYDLVLLDVLLPELNGIEILRKLKESPPQKPNNKIILLTNLGQDALIAEGISLGVRAYLIKSDYTPDQLINEVKKYLSE